MTKRGRDGEVEWSASTSATGEAECLCSGEAARVGAGEERGPRELRARAQRARRSACMRAGEELECVLLASEQRWKRTSDAWLG